VFIVTLPRAEATARPRAGVAAVAH
jgi:hypothetical protein